MAMDGWGPGHHGGQGDDIGGGNVTVVWNTGDSADTWLWIG